MTDPLGLIGRGGGGGGVYGPGGIGAPGPGVGKVDQNGPSFKDVLLDNLKQVNQLQEDATRAAEDYATGKRTDVEGVMLATQKADTAFKMLVQLRNKVQQAYEEIKQLRV